MIARQSDLDPRSPFAAGANRRVLLQRVGLAALAGGGALTLAACGGSETGAGTPSTETSSAAAPSPSTAATSASPSASPSASASAAESSSAAVPTGTKVAKADVQVGGGVILDGEKIVVTQPTAGTYKAFSAVCTHQGCTVAEIVGTDIDCNCHGSKFSIVDGSVTQAPATQPLPSKKVVESGSDLYVS